MTYLDNYTGMNYMEIYAEWYMDIREYYWHFSVTKGFEGRTDFNPICSGGFGDGFAGDFGGINGSGLLLNRLKLNAYAPYKIQD